MFTYRRSGQYSLQHNDDDEDCSGERNVEPIITTNRSNYSREIIKEAMVNYITIGCDEPDEQNWEKCRLALVRTENDMMLEFFPPNAKSIQPKCGLLCNMLDEVRQTKPLEMPERPYTALLRVSPFKSRSESSELVLSGGQQWSGVFLVRQSQTHFGECVLTFNYHGQQAKHFRILIKGRKGQCQIERLCFRSIVDLLKYFRQNPIPLRHQETDPEIVLTSFIIFEDK
ncbi:hypothetical protein BLA29_000215 [Euroglyphus maynei]|uniref:SH2 domain-containing protein n=1 Tax=Euroglyphus maynei TaxID=6958 RepID=A0A1Y3AWE5_EURMA|nr:hypothetical protein BLA29_000215 [Euroglyphus maynei]